MENTETETNNNNVPAEGNQQESAREEDFAELVESSFHRVQEGEVVTGKVVQLTPEFVMIDVGSKSEGQIPIEQFMDESGELTVRVGDDVQVFLEDTEESSGHLRISKSKADKIRIWEDIADVYENTKTIPGKVLARVKGGLQVDIGVPAFLPGSQVDLRPVRNFEKYIGETFEFNVLKYNRKRGNIVLSRRPLLEKVKEDKKNFILGAMESSGVLTGTVKNITDYGAFVDLGGIDGLLHITDMSWGRINHPSEILKVGDEIQVKILKFDQDSERVSLGLKQTQSDPWENAEEQYAIGIEMDRKSCKHNRLWRFCRTRKRDRRPCPCFGDDVDQETKASFQADPGWGGSRSHGSQCGQRSKEDFSWYKAAQTQSVGCYCREVS